MFVFGALPQGERSAPLESIMPDSSHLLNGRRLGVVGKGGAGKSTTVVLLASALRRQGHTVCVLDADSANQGFHGALGIDTPPIPLLDFFGGMVFSGGAVTCPMDDPIPLTGAELDLEHLAPVYCPRNQEGIFLLTAGKIVDKGPGAGCDGPISKIARDVRIRVGGVVPVTLVDFKAGFEDVSRGVITGFDWVIVVVDPTKAAIQMAIDMKEMVNQIKARRQPATAHLVRSDLVDAANRIFREARVRDVLVVLNRIRDREMLEYLRVQLSRGGVQVLGVIPEDPAIAISWLVGAPLGAVSLGSAETIVDVLESAESKYATTEQ